MNNYLEKFTEEVKDYTKYVGFDNFNYSVNISLRFKYVYVETPKVACSSIKTVLQKMELSDPNLYMSEFEDIHIRNYSPLLTPLQVHGFNNLIQDDNFLKFCFVRNPYDRLLSSYLNKIRGGQPQKKKILAQLGFDPVKIDEKISFDEFVKAVVVQPISFMDPHWRIQYYQTFQDNIKYNFIGKLESFDEDFSKILEKINPDHSKYLSVEKRHATDAKSKLGEYYTEELRDLVYTKFKKDFDFFNYSSIISEISNDNAKEIAGLSEITEDNIEQLNKKL